MMILALAASLLLQAPASGEGPRAAEAGSLKTTIRLSVVKLDGPGPTSAGAATPYGNFGPLLAQLITPEGSVDIVYTIAGSDTRAEVGGRLATLPRGSVVLQRFGDETIRVLNPGNKTWYEIPANQNLGALLGTPDVTVEPLNERARIAGHSADRYRFRETLRVPVPEGVSLPSDFPKDIELAGDLWSTGDYAGGAYAGVFKTLQSFAAIPGVEALTEGGRFPLRIALRSTVMPGYEIRSEVTAIGPTAPDAALFTVPAGYQKVQPPMGGQGGIPNSATPQLPSDTQPPTAKSQTNNSIGSWKFALFP